MKSPLATKMARVMGAVERPRGAPGDVLGAIDALDDVRSKLSAEAIAVFPHLAEHTVREAIDNRGRYYHARVTLELTFIDGESGDQHTITWVGEGTDRGDKSYYKAYVDAFNSALLHTFLIPQGES